jgi:four helix bundle protein
MFNFEKLEVWQKAIDFADFARFTEIAAGSVFEVVSQAFIARRRSFFSEEQFRDIYADAEQLSRMLSGLRKSLLSTLNSQL